MRRKELVLPNRRGIVAKVGRVGPGFVTEGEGLLVEAERVPDVLHGIGHVLVPDTRAEVPVEDLGHAVLVENGALGVEIDEARLFFGPERHGCGRVEAETRLAETR